MDNDGHSPQSDRLIRFAAEQLQQQGKAVWMAQPKIEGQDYNDVLKEQGAAAVKTELQQAVSFAEANRLSPDKIALGMDSEVASTWGHQLGESRLAQEKQIQVEGSLLLPATEKKSLFQENTPLDSPLTIKDRRPSPTPASPPPQPIPQRERELELDL